MKHTSLKKVLKLVAIILSPPSHNVLNSHSSQERYISEFVSNGLILYQTSFNFLLHEIESECRRQMQLNNEFLSLTG